MRFSNYKMCFQGKAARAIIIATAARASLGAKALEEFPNNQSFPSFQRILSNQNSPSTRNALSFRNSSRLAEIFHDGAHLAGREGLAVLVVARLFQFVP